MAGLYIHRTEKNTMHSSRICSRFFLLSISLLALLSTPSLAQKWELITTSAHGEHYLDISSVERPDQYLVTFFMRDVLGTTKHLTQITMERRSRTFFIMYTTRAGAGEIPPNVRKVQSISPGSVLDKFYNRLF